MRSMRLPVAFLIVMIATGRSIAADPPDALDDALRQVGMQRADLGWQPKGWWPRFPADIPYKLRAFDSLFAEPLDTVVFTRHLGEAARKHLDPTVLDEIMPRGTGNLYHAVHLLGIDPKFGGGRGYSPNLTADDTPLADAILALHRAAGRRTSFVTFGTESPYPKLAEDLAEKVAVIPADAQPVLGRLVLNIIDAHRWAELAFRNVDPAKRHVVATRLNIGEEQTDALDYCPEVDDVARSWDQASLWYAGEKCVQALDDARLALQAIEDVPPFVFDWQTPWGWIRVRGGGDDSVDGHDALLIVDLGGNDRYTGPVAGTTGQRPIGLLLDCNGNDRYHSQDIAQGAGMCGVGILLDAGGDDTYVAKRYAQGVGQFGLGICADLGGRDQYVVRYSGQGCGYFGVGLLLEAGGDDLYVLHADGQGLGGVGGVGVLADRSGNDRYSAVRDAEYTGRPSYHSPDAAITVSNAQGCGMGRRGDGADGHSWAGGLGALLDSEGDDRYVSGNWSQGTGYWFGVGLLHDGGGNDEYRGVAYSQASGAHFCIGALIDEGGDDLHIGEATSNMCMAWAHDFTIALLINVGGNDTYDLKGNGLSYSINRSVAALIDIGGDDIYRGKEGNHPAMTDFNERYRPKGGVSSYFADTTSVAIFLDVGGTDTYWTGATDNSTWLNDADSPNAAERNFTVGVDRAEGNVSFRPRPMKTPSLPIAKDNGN